MLTASFGRTDISVFHIVDRNVCSTEAGHFEFRRETSVRDGRGCKPRPACGDTPIVRAIRSGRI